jgi:aminoglycoside phosphotransferase (APT) family kinase protein
MILDPADPGRVIAILDWEMATLGDPLSDLGYTLNYYAEPADSDQFMARRNASPATRHPGFLSRDEIVAEYARRTGRNVDHIDYYQVLALYKLTIISAGIWARYLKGETVGEGFEGIGGRMHLLAEEALAIADASSDPRLRGQT